MLSDSGSLSVPPSLRSCSQVMSECLQEVINPAGVAGTTEDTEGTDTGSGGERATETQLAKIKAMLDTTKVLLSQPFCSESACAVQCSKGHCPLTTLYLTDFTCTHLRLSSY